MTASGFLTVSPKVEGSMAPEIAKAVDALEDHPVSYETTPMGTLLEAEDAATLFAAAQAAHEAVDSDRVVTFLKLDDKRATDAPMREKVDAVEERLGRDARGGPD
ncbi:MULTISPECIES: thiamine-binding protein [Salinibaculum]|uniref:thiamine-binding protein n=1 Tax=Salinibaculum TaxID=2732368 RepID=UPI0030CB6008